MSEPFLPERWAELGPLLDAALERAPAERAAFVERACAGDAALRVELQTLLDECARGDPLFATGAVEHFASLLSGETHGLPAMVARRYRVERELGAGGMAIVYLARDVKHDREVALKMLRTDLSALVGSERFLAEVRITAKLDHPNILTLIDSGSADGTLFYVLPYVRGESLRAKLARERQLSLDDALAITRQIAAALDYAHAQGIVHRDIKPENILLHEGVAMLADFGIALAVKEAGGDRLTATGLSLGTPQYMSPEQATGDRALDARSDIYSLAAVLYEMIAGEPPVTGATAQAIIARLLTEPPRRLRTLRDTVPEGMDRVVAKALAKVPADRFATADEFARALEGAVAAIASAPFRRWHRRTILATVGVVALVVVAVPLRRGSIGGAHAGATLRDHTQITFTGHVAAPAISGDGKTLAYRTTNCGSNGCTFGIELQDVSGSVAPRPLFDGASAIYQIEWSPDGRNLLFNGTINPRYGTYLVSALAGGMPKRVATNATFFAGGDSLLSEGAAPDADDKWVIVSGLDGVVHDSVQVAGRGGTLAFFKAVPGSNRIVVGVKEGGLLEARVVERDGRVASRTSLGNLGVYRLVEAHTSFDALWVSTLKTLLSLASRSVLRVPLDAVSGRLSPIVDTLYAGVYTAFSVTADGSHIVLDEGTAEFGLYAFDMSEAVGGGFPDEKRLLRHTSEIVALLSPDGRRMLVGRDIGAGAGMRRRWSTMPFAGGAETPLALHDQNVEVHWSDSATVAIGDTTPAGIRLSLQDVATGAVRDRFVVSDTQVTTFATVPSGGWAWMNRRQHAAYVRLPGQPRPRQLPLPAWYFYSVSLDASSDSRFIGFSGYKSPDQDSIGVSVISLADGTVTPWFTGFGEGGNVRRLKDGSFFLQLQDTPESSTLYHLLGPGHAVKIGTIPRALKSVTVSEDLKRAAIVVRDYHGDAWMSRVVVRR